VTVQRENPDNLVQFAANYFNRLNLTDQGEGPGQDSSSGAPEIEMMVEGEELFSNISGCVCGG